MHAYSIPSGPDNECETKPEHGVQKGKRAQGIQADENDQSEYTNMHNQLTTCLFCDSLLMSNEIRFVRDEKK
jgi:hypothetical protein